MNLQALFHRHPELIWQLALLALATIVANFVIKHLITYIERQSTRTETFWDDALLEAARQPLRVLVWVIGFSIGVDMIEQVQRIGWQDGLQQLREVLYIVLVAWFGIRLIAEAEYHYKQPHKDGSLSDAGTIDAIGKLARITLFVLAGLVLLEKIGYSISGLLAFGGIGGVAIGFAAKDLVANFFGGLMIYLDKPFAVGDHIRSPQQDIDGVVESISWRLTVIRTGEKRPLYVPNAVFTSISVENISRMTCRRLTTAIGLRYDDADRLPQVIAGIENMLRHDSDIDNNQAVSVTLTAFGVSSLDLILTCFLKSCDGTEYNQRRHRVLLAVYQEICRHGAELAYPTQLHYQEPLKKSF